MLHDAICRCIESQATPLSCAIFTFDMGEEKKAWYQTFLHELDIAAFIPSVSVRMMRNDIFAMTYGEDVIEFGRDNSSITNHDLYRKPPLFKHWFDVLQATDKYPEDYDCSGSLTPS